jgi:hypothetical protein
MPEGIATLETRLHWRPIVDWRVFLDLGCLQSRLVRLRRPWPARTREYSPPNHSRFIARCYRLACGLDGSWQVESLMYQTTAILQPELRVWVPVIAAVVGGLAAIVGTVYAVWRRVPQDLQIEYDKDLRSQRIQHYKTLWSRTLPLAKYPKSTTLAYYGANESVPTARFGRLLRKLLRHENGAEEGVVDSIHSLSISLRDWYFEGGGLFLSESTRDTYFNLQDGLKIILQKRERRWPGELDAMAREQDIYNIARKLDTGSDMNNREEQERYKEYQRHLRKHLEREKNWKAPPRLVMIASSQLDRSKCEVPEEIHTDLMRLGGSLRTRLSQDVLTRESSYLRRRRA